jgi:hypothetical protein
MDKKLMHTSDGMAENFARLIVDGAEINREHVGRRLLESLNKPIADCVRYSDFNPQDIDDMDYDAVVNWLNEHIVFDSKGKFIGLFDGMTWLWEADHDARR